MIIVDENVDQLLIDQLKESSYKIISIRDQHAGISDREVIEIAKIHQGIVITEDKDFGELVFSYYIRGCSVILLRYGKPDHDKIVNKVLKGLDECAKSREHLFITITNKKIRMRRI